MRKTKGVAGMKRLKRFCVLFVLIFAAAILALPVSAASTGRVTELDFTGILEKSGKCRITLVVNMQFDDPSGEIMLPLGENVSGVSVAGGGAYKKTVDDSVWVVLRSSRGTVGTRTCVISYTKANCIKNVSDGQELDVQLVCPLWEMVIDHVTYSLTLPAEFDAKPGYRSGYYGETVNAKDVVDGQTIRGEISGGLLDRESVDLVMKLPANYVRLWHQTGETSTVDIILFCLFAALGLLYWYLTLRNPIVRRQTQKRPPEGLSAWEFPHIVQGSSLDPTLLISEWAVLGYLTVRVEKNGRIRLSPRIPMGSERRPLESGIFKSLFPNGETVAADTPDFRRVCKKASQDAKGYWSGRLYSRKSGNPLFTDLAAALAMGFSWMYAMDWILPSWTLRILILLPFLALGIAAGILLQQSFRAILRGRTDGLLTGAAALLVTLLLCGGDGSALMPLGGVLLQLLDAAGTLHGGKCLPSALEWAAQIRAFRRFLRQASPHHLQLVLAQDGQYFYNLLPYAEAMGIGRQFASCFANLPMEPCAWLQGDRLHYQTAAEFYRYYKAVRGKMQGRRGVRLPTGPDRTEI